LSKIPLSNPSILRIKDGFADRLRRARERLGLKQVEFAERTGVSRSTQIGYERGVTEPTTGYLRSAQENGVDIAELLFDASASETKCLNFDPDWNLIQHCSETVEFFCLRFAPNCPASYRWQMTRKLYDQMMGQGRKPPDQRQPLEALTKIWADYAK
jgi:transcriptional regulator with XRE-family HTH domain